MAYLSRKSSRGDRCHGLLHRADSDVSATVLLLRYRTRAAPDSAPQCDFASDIRVGGAAVARGFSRSWPVSLCDSRSRLEIQCRRNPVPEINRTDAETHQRTVAVAKRDRVTLDRKLPPRASRSCDSSE